MKTSKVIIGMAAAAAAGVAIGMLIAPEKGSDLQKKLKSGAQNWLDEISRLIHAEKRMITEGEEEIEKTLHDISNN